MSWLTLEFGIPGEAHWPVWFPLLMCVIAVLVLIVVLIVTRERHAR